MFIFIIITSMAITPIPSLTPSLWQTPAMRAWTNQPNPNISATVKDKIPTAVVTSTAVTENWVTNVMWRSATSTDKDWRRSNSPSDAISAVWMSLDELRRLRPPMQPKPVITTPPVVPKIASAPMVKPDVKVNIAASSVPVKKTDTKVRSINDQEDDKLNISKPTIIAPSLRSYIDSWMKTKDAIAARRDYLQSQKAPQVPKVESVNAENIYDTYIGLLKKQTEAEKSWVNTDMDTTKKALDKSYDLIDSFYSTELSNISSDTDAFEKELQTAQTGFESNRMNQVRSQIIQSLSSRWIDISTIPPEQLIALSWEVGVSAFNDVYEKKINMQSRIREAKNQALAQMRELRAKKALNEDEYKKSIADLEISSQAKIRQLDTAFNNAFLWVAEKRIAWQDIAQTQALNVLNTIGIDTSKLGSLLEKVKWATSASSANKIIYDWLATPEWVNAVREANIARSSQQNIENQLKEASLNAEIAYRNATNDNDRIKTAIALKDSYQALYDKYISQYNATTDETYKNKAIEALNKASAINIWTVWGSTIAPSP